MNNHSRLLFAGASTTKCKNHAGFLLSITEHVQDEMRYICAGSLIAQNIVLTAAHCVTDVDQISYKVTAEYNGESLQSDVKKIRMPSSPKYGNMNIIQDDIALLWLKNPLPRDIVHARIDSVGGRFGNMCVGSAKTYYKSNRRFETTLEFKAREIQTSHPSNCRPYGSKPYGRELCAKHDQCVYYDSNTASYYRKCVRSWPEFSGDAQSYVEASKVYPGDSGGPLFFVADDDVPIVCGVTKSTNDRYSMFTDTSPHLFWIWDTIRQEEEGLFDLPVQFSAYPSNPYGVVSPTVEFDSPPTRPWPFVERQKWARWITDDVDCEPVDLGSCTNNAGDTFLRCQSACRYLYDKCVGKEECFGENDHPTWENQRLKAQQQIFEVVFFHSKLLDEQMKSIRISPFFRCYADVSMPTKYKSFLVFKRYASTRIVCTSVRKKDKFRVFTTFFKFYRWLISSERSHDQDRVLETRLSFYNNEGSVPIRVSELHTHGQSNLNAFFTIINSDNINSITSGVFLSFKELSYRMRHTRPTKTESHPDVSLDASGLLDTVTVAKEVSSLYVYDEDGENMIDIASRGRSSVFNQATRKAARAMTMKALVANMYFRLGSYDAPLQPFLSRPSRDTNMKIYNALKIDAPAAPFERANSFDDATLTESTDSWSSTNSWWIVADSGPDCECALERFELTNTLITGYI